jgi:hypothetical protein
VQIGDTGVIQSLPPTSGCGGNIRQALQPQQAMDHRIFLVIAHILKPTIAQQQMNEQQQHHDTMAEDRADRQVAETSAQLLLQANTGKQRLIHNKARERGQPLVFEFDLGNAMGFTMDFGFASLHANGLRWFFWFGVVPPILPTQGPFFYDCQPFSCNRLCFLDFTFGEVQH